MWSSGAKRSCENCKIGLLIPSLRDGGVERVMINLADGLVSLGYAVDLLACTSMDGPLVDEIPNGVGRVSLGAINPYRASLRLASYVRAERPVAIFSALTPANISAILAKSLLRAQNLSVRVGVGVHVSIQATYASSLFKGVVRPLAYRLCYDRADAIIVPSEGVRRELIRTGLKADSIKTIYNPIVTSRTLALANLQPDHEWFTHHDLPVVLAVGRLHPQKAFLTLLNAFREVRETQHCRLMILGEGGERANIERAVREYGLEKDVSLPGFVVNPYSFMRSSDLFVLSSEYEGFGNVVAEALCIGTRVVSTDCPSGPREILADGRYGRLVPVGDVRGLAAAIIEGITSPWNPSGMSAHTEVFRGKVAAGHYLTAVGLGASAAVLEER